MSKKRHSRRTIVVDGVTYTWRYGDWVEIRRGREVILRRRITDILGITNVRIKMTVATPTKSMNAGYTMAPRTFAENSASALR